MTHPCRAWMPAGLGVGGCVVAGEDGGTVVVVVVGAEVAEVVVVVDAPEGGAVVVEVVVLVVGGPVLGWVVVVVVVVVLLVVVVVVVVLLVVVVAEGTVVVVVAAEGTVVVVVVVGVLAGAGAVVVVVPVVALGPGTVIVALVHAPAVCRVATSTTMRTRARFSAMVSAVSAETACSSALAAASRRACEARRAASALLVRANTSEAATLSYCWATTPSGVGGPNVPWPGPGLRYELLTYSPVLTYSSTAKLRSTRSEASNLARVEEVAARAAPSCWFQMTTSRLSVATAKVASCQLCRSAFTLPYRSRAEPSLSTLPARLLAVPKMTLA